MSIKIYGHSDDCIEIEGDGFHEEFYLRDGRSFLRFDDGTVVECTFGEDGFGWSFTEVTTGKGTVVATSEIDDELDMTMTLDGKITQVWHDATPKGPNMEQFLEAVDDLDWGEIDTDPDALNELRAKLAEFGVKL